MPPAAAELLRRQCSCSKKFFQKHLEKFASINYNLYICIVIKNVQIKYYKKILKKYLQVSIEFCTFVIQ